MGKSLNGRELGKGITQRKDGRYQIRFTNRFGVRETHYTYKFVDAVNMMRELQYEDSKAMNVANPDLTVDEWFETWLELYKVNTCRNTTIEQYKRTYKNLSKDIGNVRVSELNHAQIQQSINKLTSEGSRKLTRSVIVDMMKYAEETGIINKNPTKRIKVRNVNDIVKEKIALNDEEVRIILEYSEGLVVNPFIKLGLNTGMRVGELTGLTWDNIDFKKKCIYVRKQLVTIKNPETNKWCVEFHPPKSKAGNRTIPMTEEVFNTLKELEEKKKNVLKKCENKDITNDFVLISSNNTPYFRAAVSKLFDVLYEKIVKDYPHFPKFSPHTLRHTFASNMIAKGVQPKVLQTLMGHNDISTTMNLYCHTDDSQLYNAMNLFQENGVNSGKMVSINRRIV